jgi:hypothetical protein
MIAGDSADWDDFFQQNLIPVVLALVISAWDSMEKSGQTAHEVEISVERPSPRPRNQGNAPSPGA